MTIDRCSYLQGRLRNLESQNGHHGEHTDIEHLTQIIRDDITLSLIAEQREDKVEKSGPGLGLDAVRRYLGNRFSILS